MKKQLSLVTVILTFAATYIISCSKSNNKQPTPPPPPTCDTANIKYATDIANLMLTRG